jgi:2-hydroxy-3-oxopropionate reductase
MAGGDSVVIASLSAMFAELGRLTHVGPVGSGQLAKLANQLIVGVTIGAVSEALLLAEAGGADPEAVRDALLGGFAESAILRQHGARMVERDFAPGAHATTQLKDLETIQDLAAALALELRFAALAREQFGRMCAGSGASLDHSALYLEMRRAHPGVFS